MNPATVLPSPPPKRRWLTFRLFGPPWMRVLLVVLTVVGAFYAEEDWRGQRDWKRYQEAAKARGESLDYASYIPKPVPDDQNFAAAPFLRLFMQPTFTLLPDDLYARADNHIMRSIGPKEKGRRHFTDLVAWQMASTALQTGPVPHDQHFETDKTDLAARAAAAPEVLEGMKPDAEVFAELRAAGNREYSRFPVVYDLENPWLTLLPHLSKVKQTVERLNLEACAELAAGQSDQALADEKLMLSLADSVKSEPFLISFLVRVACVQIAVQPVWEGLAERRWTDAQLQELQTRFLLCDFLADIDRPLKAERSVGALTADMVRKKGYGYFMNFMVVDSLQNQRTSDTAGTIAINSFGLLAPSGWYYEEQLNYCTLFDALMNGVVDPAARKVSPRKVTSNDNDLTRQLYGGSWASPLKPLYSHRLVAAMLLPGLVRVPLKAAMAQTATDQAALACALERYRLANGQFPETLEALTPGFMSRAPNDVISGRAFKYRRTVDGQFILYSIGWNEKDDGGVPGKKGLFDDEEGDWVWSYPAK